MKARFGDVPIAPHLLFFWLYNAIYFLPLVVIYIWGYSEGYALEAIALDERSLRLISIIYAEGLIAFTAGSITVGLFRRRRSRDHRAGNDYPVPQLGIAEKTLVLLVAALFIVAKGALIPLGVYHAYAADTGEMTGGIWSFAMVCAEFMVLASILVLFSDAKRNIAGFVLLSLLNGVNLLHGTRIIFIVNVMLIIFYGYLRGTLSLRRMLILGPILFLGVLAMTYAVFLSRSGSDGGELTFAKAFSPIVYESLLSQISLRTVVDTPDVLNSTGALPSFLVDMIAFITPRFVLPDKDAVQYLGQFTYMSPLGAFNGYAAGVIYFGVFWPIFYLLLGGIANWLYAKSKTNAYWFLLYVYFTADVLFRFMRDGYSVPVKISANIIELLLLLMAFKALLRGLSRHKIARSTALERQAASRR
jgi:hypothetical protein